MKYIIIGSSNLEKYKISKNRANILQNIKKNKHAIIKFISSTKK